MPQTIVNIPGVGKIRFPEGMDAKQIETEASRLLHLGPSSPQAGFQSPRYPGTGATPGQVAQDQAANVVRGVPEAITGIPAAVGGLGSLAWKALKGENINRESGQMVEGMVKPFQTSLEGATELAYPGSMGPEVAPESPEWAQAARSGGTMLAGAELPNALSGAKVLANPVFQRMKGMTPRIEASMRSRAAANRAASEGDIIDTWAKSGNAAGGTVKAARQTYGKVAAPIQERIAAKLAAETPEEAFARVQAQRNAVLPDAESSSGRPVGAERPSTPSFIQRQLDDARGSETPEQLYAREQARRNVEFQPEAGAQEPLAIPRPKPGEIPPASQSRTLPTSADLNKWMNVRENQLLYGKNPGGRILQENLLGPDKPTTLTNVSTARKSVGSQMDDAFKRAESQGVRFELESDIRAAIADAKKTIGKSTDESFMRSIEGVESEIVSRMDDLKSVAPSAAHELEVELGRGVKWTGASSDVQRLLKDIRGRISRKLKTIEGIVPLKERWGDLFEAEQALKSSIRKDAIGRGTGTVLDRLKGQ